MIWNILQKVLQESKTLENRINSYKKMQSELEDIITLIELSLEEGETESTPDMNAECDAFIKKLEEMKLASLLTGEYDHSNAILTFHAGAGGTEAQDWAEMLYRMYNRWAERHHFKVTTLDYLDGDEAGLKSASILIEGENAYGFLKSESGVHRLVRVFPFDASGRRHTSFSAVEVMPEIDDNMEVDIRPEDIRDGCIPFQRCRRSAHQQDQFCGSVDALANGHCCFLPDTEKPIPEQGICNEDVEVQVGGNQGTGTPR